MNYRVQIKEPDGTVAYLTTLDLSPLGYERF